MFISSFHEIFNLQNIYIFSVFNVNNLIFHEDDFGFTSVEGIVLSCPVCVVFFYHH